MSITMAEHRVIITDVDGSVIAELDPASIRVPAVESRRESAWYWTPARSGTRCDECREPVPHRRLIAFQYSPERRVICEICADTLGLDPKLSKRAKEGRSSRRSKKKYV